MTAANHDNQLGEIIQQYQTSLTVHLTLVFHVFIAVAIMIMVCGHRGLWSSWYMRMTAETVTVDHTAPVVVVDVVIAPAAAVHLVLVVHQFDVVEVLQATSTVAV